MKIQESIPLFFIFLNVIIWLSTNYIFCFFKFLKRLMQSSKLINAFYTFIQRLRFIAFEMRIP